MNPTLKILKINEGKKKTNKIFQCAQCSHIRQKTIFTSFILISFIAKIPVPKAMITKN